MCVQEWLRKGIYQRSGIKSKSMNQLYVFAVSAFWHGFYISYYLSFSFWFMQLHVQGLIFKYCKNGRSIFVKVYKSLGILGKILLSTGVQFIFSSVAAPFLIIRVKYCIEYMSKVNFTPHIILIILMVVFTFMRPPRDPHHQEHHKDGEQGHHNKHHHSKKDEIEEGAK